MDREDALKKIKKCLAMARSTSQFEAAAAMRQAQALMKEYGVKDGDVDLLEVVEVKANAATNAPVMWEARLFSLITDSFGCEGFYSLSLDANLKRARQCVFVGVDAAPHVAAYAYEVLARQLVKARSEYVARQSRNCKASTKTARGDEFAKGWAMAVRDLVEKMAMPPANEALVKRYLQEKHPELAPAGIKDRGTRAAGQGHAEAGFRAGRSAQLSRAVGGRAARPLLSGS